MNFCETAYRSVLARIESARARAGRSDGVRLLAVSKTKPAQALLDLHRAGQVDFGENYVQEALAKQREIAAADGTRRLAWHLIGPLQSNKCRETALHFDWLQSLDRAKLIAPLSRHRPPDTAPLNVLIQVNVDDEDSKSGCAPDEIDALAASVAAAPGLRLRGLMAIPAPAADTRRDAFRRMRGLFETLRGAYADVDTLSMGMSEDFELAIEEGATMVRIGTAVFGPR